MRVSSDVGGWGVRGLWGWWAGGDGDRFTEKREVLVR